MKIQYLIALLLSLLATLPSKAQSIFNEGKIVYNIYMPNKGTEVVGKLIVLVKQGQMKREMIMNNGYYNLIISNTDGSSVTYSDFNGNKVAQKKSMADVQVQNKQFVNAEYTIVGQKKSIAGIDCQMVAIKYANGNSNNVYYTDAYKSSNPVFNAMFPDLKGIPLSYEVAGNIKIVLEAVEFKAMPVDKAEFNEPKGYKIAE
jgi:hypothetical protein